MIGGSLPQTNFESLYTLKRSLKSSQMIDIEGVSEQVKWSIEVY